MMIDNSNSANKNQFAAIQIIGIAFVLAGSYATLFTSFRVGLVFMIAGVAELLIVYYMRDRKPPAQQNDESDNLTENKPEDNAIFKFVGGVGFILGFFILLYASIIVGASLIFIAGYLFVKNSDENFDLKKTAIIVGLFLFILLVSQGEIQEFREARVVHSVCDKLRSSYPDLKPYQDTGGPYFWIVFSTEQEKAIFIKKATDIIGDDIEKDRLKRVFGLVQVNEKRSEQKTTNNK